MDIAIRILGIALILLPAVDLFRELFQPGGRGLLSVMLARAWWRVLRGPVRRSSRVASLVGPIIMISIIMSWLVSAAFGWALVLWPSIESAVSHAGPAGDEPGFIHALYLSLVTVSTLGFGDVVPTATWARILVPIEALFGLGLAGGTISWLLTVHPVLSHREALATRISVLEQAERSTGVKLERTEGAHDLLNDLTAHLTSVHADMVHTPVGYYFVAGEQRRALPDQIEYLDEVSTRCTASDIDAVRLAAAMLSAELRELLATVAVKHLRLPADAPAERLVEAWRFDHPVPTP